MLRNCLPIGFFFSLLIKIFVFFLTAGNLAVKLIFGPFRFKKDPIIAFN